MKIFWIALIEIVLVVSIIDACAHNGVCGHGTSCHGSTGSSSHSTSSHSSCATTGCSGGYSCGTYGCYRSRARSGTIARVNDVRRRGDLSQLSAADGGSGDAVSGSMKETPMLQLSNANNFGSRKTMNPDDVFLDCCLERQLPDPCLNLCSYRTFNRDALQRMYFKQSRCPFEVSSELQYCAAQGGDHRMCCERNGVGATLAGRKCLIFCDQRPGECHVSIRSRYR